MALIVEDRILETSTTTGTGALTLAGALTGFRTFASVCTSPSDTVYYMIEGVDGSGVPTGEWETGLGTYSAANTLTRTTVSRSSNAGAAVTFSAGTKRVSIGASARYLAKNVDVLSGTFDPRTGFTFSNAYVGLRPLTVPFDMTATGVRIRLTAAAGTASIEPVIYSSTADGQVSTQLANGSTVVGVAAGINGFPLSTPVALTQGQLVWVGLNLQNATLSMVTQASAVAAYWSQASIPAPSTPPATTYGTNTWASMWLYGRQS